MKTNGTRIVLLLILAIVAIIDCMIVQDSSTAKEQPSSATIISLSSQM